MLLLVGVVTIVTSASVAAVVSVVVVVVLSVLAVSVSSLLVQEETSNAMLTIRTNRDNKNFTLFLFLILKVVGLKSHKFKLFNPIDRLTKLNINFLNCFKTI